MTHVILQWNFTTWLKAFKIPIVGQCSSFEWFWAQLGENMYLKGAVMIACIIRDP